MRALNPDRPQDGYGNVLRIKNRMALVRWPDACPGGKTGYFKSDKLFWRV